MQVGRSLGLGILVLLLIACGNQACQRLPTVQIPPGMRAVGILIHQDM